MKKAIKYEPETCSCCGQTTTYVSKINKGMATFLLAFASAVRLQNKNDLQMKALIADADEVDDMTTWELAESGKITHSQYDNRSHLRCHGLIANTGVNRYCLTKKGAAFLRGHDVEAAAIVEKRTHSNIGYVADANGTLLMTNIKDVFKSDSGWWDGWDYEIVDGRLEKVAKEMAQFTLL